jgi:hypothetical protein
MKRLQLAVLAIFCLSAPALAQSAHSTNATPQWRAQLNVPDWNRPQRLVHDANQCAPVYAQPVWGPNSGLLGYSCSNYSNGS